MSVLSQFNRSISTEIKQDILASATEHNTYYDSCLYVSLVLSPL